MKNSRRHRCQPCIDDLMQLCKHVESLDRYRQWAVCESCWFLYGSRTIVMQLWWSGTSLSLCQSSEHWFDGCARKLWCYRLVQNPHRLTCQDPGYLKGIPSQIQIHPLFLLDLLLPLWHVADVALQVSTPTRDWSVHEQEHLLLKVYFTKRANSFLLASPQISSCSVWLPDR